MVLTCTSDRCEFWLYRLIFILNQNVHEILVMKLVWKCIKIRLSSHQDASKNLRALMQTLELGHKRLCASHGRSYCFQVPILHVWIFVCRPSWAYQHGPFDFKHKGLNTLSVQSQKGSNSFDSEMKKHHSASQELTYIQLIHLLDQWIWSNICLFLKQSFKILRTSVTVILIIPCRDKHVKSIPWSKKCKG